MVVYAVKRILQLIPVLLGISVLVFLLLHLIPGDPAIVLLGQDATPQDVARLRSALGLDQPVWVQLEKFLVRLVQGDLGRSIFQQEKVSDLVLRHIPATIELTLAAMLVAVLIAVPMGVISAVRQYSVFDYGTMIFAQLGVSMPVFWLGVLAILLFSVKLNWLPSFGRGEPILDGLWILFTGGDADPLLGGLKRLAMPASALGLTAAALITRMVRSAMLEVLRLDYIRTARAKGLSNRVVIFKHAFRNALLPVVTIIGLQFGSLLGGAVVTETVFAWPGVGRLTVQAIGQRDFPLVQGGVLLVALTFAVVNLLVDMSYAWINPRIRYHGGS